MNGDSQKILDAIKENGNQISKIYTKLGKLETTQELRHEQNVKDIKRIFAHDDKCVIAHQTTKSSLKIQWFLISGIILGLMSVAWTAVK